MVFKIKYMIYHKNGRERERKKGRESAQETAMVRRGMKDRRRDAEGRNANLAWNQRSLRLLGTRGKENSKSSLWRRREGLSHGFVWVRTV